MPAGRILVIDDDIELCEEIKESLQAEGYVAECTQDTIEGERLVRSGSFDTVLLDFKMPNQSSVNMLKKLKADNVKKRIFIFSGKPFVERELKEIDLMDMTSGIISKPISFDALLDKIKKYPNTPTMC